MSKDEIQMGFECNLTDCAASRLDFVALSSRFRSFTKSHISIPLPPSSPPASISDIGTGI